MAFQPSHPHPFGFDMNATHLKYHAPQQTNPHTEYYPDSKNADPTINDVAMMAPNSSSHDYRKDSVATNSGAMANAEASWDHKQLYPGSAFDSSHAFRPSDNNGYVQHDHTPVYPHAPPEWIMSPTGSVDTTSFDAYQSAKFENSPFPGSLPSDQASFAPMQNHGFSRSHHVSSPAQASLSPPAHADWMDMTGPNKPFKAAEIKSIKPRHQPILKRDGIRKKNAKIPIPSEITLENIDDLIENCTDEDEMKQLKAQKRLLRNREAALASRQRKKKHTENLEQKEKDLEGKLHMLYQQVETLKLQLENQLENAESQRQFFNEERAKAHEIIQTLHMEKEDLICKHTRETGALRSQIRIYREQFESSPAPAMSAAPSSTGFTDFNLEMDHLQIEDQPWDRFINVQGHDDDLDAPDYLGNTAESYATIQPGKPSVEHAQHDKNNTTDQPVASGILFMLLLCGAFVASRSATTASHPAIPKMPEEVRAASTEVLQNLLRDNPQQASLFLPDLTPAPIQRHPSNRNNTQWTHSHPSANNNHIHNLHKHLTSPTRLQQAEQAFALTPDFYNSVTSSSHLDAIAAQQQYQPPQPSQRPNLQEALKEMQEARQGNGSMAEVYTRSLLWDQIPLDVQRQFRRAVAESRGEGEGERADDAEMGER